MLALSETVPITPNNFEGHSLVAENVFTNFLNEVALTDIDFPVVRALAA